MRLKPHLQPARTPVTFAAERRSQETRSVPDVFPRGAWEREKRILPFLRDLRHVFYIFGCPHGTGKRGFPHLQPFADGLLPGVFGEDVETCLNDGFARKCHLDLPVNSGSRPAWGTENAFWLSCPDSVPCFTKERPGNSKGMEQLDKLTRNNCGCQILIIRYGAHGCASCGRGRCRKR